MLNVTVATWIGNAAAVLSGTWGAVTRRAQQSGSSRTAVYTHAQRVVQAVASEQAGQDQLRCSLARKRAAQGRKRSALASVGCRRGVQ